MMDYIFEFVSDSARAEFVEFLSWPAQSRYLYSEETRYCNGNPYPVVIVQRLRESAADRMYAWANSHHLLFAD